MIKNFISQATAVNFLQQQLNKDSTDILIDGIRIINKCQFYGQGIKFPARSVMCTTHFQPFDIKSLIYSSIKAISSSRKWKCPFCGARAYDSSLDMLLTSLLSQHSNIKEIFFSK